MRSNRPYKHKCLAPCATAGGLPCWRGVSAPGERCYQHREITNERMKMTTDYQGLVREFHETFGHPVADRPTLPDLALASLRVALIKEELEELRAALIDGNVIEIADALGDILYVTFGAGVAFGIGLDEVFEEIQRSNMAKLGPDGKPILREDGKILKPDGWMPPNIARVIERQQAEGVR